MEIVVTKTSSSTYGAFYERRKLIRVPLEPELVEIFKYVDDCLDTYIEDLRKLVEIPSIAGSMPHRNYVKKLVKLVEEWLTILKVKYECHVSGWENVDGVYLPKPVIITGTLGTDPAKKTLCIYSHLDVTSPVDETWSTDPFKLCIKNDTIYGKGVAYGKGPLICWFHAIQAYQNKKTPLPVNIKFIIESMNTYQSDGLENLLVKIQRNFSSKIHFVVVCASKWLGSSPCLIHGTAGTCQFEISVEQFEDSDPISDMQTIISKIVSSNNKILIPRFTANVECVTSADKLRYTSIDYDPEECRLGTLNEGNPINKVQCLINLWRLPDVAIDENEILVSSETNTMKVKRNIYFKLVPKQTPEEINNLVLNHVYNVCKNINCRSRVDCSLIDSSSPWVVDCESKVYEAAKKATVQVYNENASIIRLDHSIPELLLLKRVLKKEIIVLPLANETCNAQQGDENMLVTNFSESSKFLCAFIKQLSYI